MTDGSPNSSAVTGSTLPMDSKEAPPVAQEVEVASNANNATKSRSKLRKLMILMALFLSLFIAALDVTIVATAIPTITADLHSPSGYAWIGGAYVIANAAGVPIWAKLSDIWGRKPILLLAVLVFIASSIICALAVSMKMLIIGRAVQGVAGGGLILMVNIVISDLFSMRQRSLILGLCEGIWAIAGAIGPILGGVLTDLASWRWCWWINLPVCGVGFALLLIFLDIHNPRTKFSDGIKAIDWAGSLSILAFTLMLLIGLDFGGDAFPWSSPRVICLIVFGFLCLGVFVFSEHRLAEYPLIPLDLFNERSNIGSLAVSFFHAMTFIAGEYYLPLYFQAVKLASPLRSGVLLAPLIVMTAVCGTCSGVFIHQTGKYRIPIWTGASTLTLGTGLYISMTPTTSIGAIIGFQLVAGIGSGMLFQPPLISLQAFVTDQNDVATATSTFSFVRCIALAFSIILGGVVFQNSMDKQGPQLAKAGLSADLLAQLNGKNAAAHVNVAATLSDQAQKRAVESAFAASMRNMWIMFCCFGFLAIVSSALIKSKKLSMEHTETVTGLKKQARAQARDQNQDQTPAHEV
ncbi:hypothetical protein DV736_g1185, partial [Chaetothyriales sp. CBS 134916]